MIGNTLEHIRKIYGYTIAQVCESLHMSPGYMSEIEHGRKQPSLELLQNYADVYGMRLSTLISLQEAVEEIQKSEKDDIAVRIATTQRISSILMEARKRQNSDPVFVGSSDRMQENRKVQPEMNSWTPVKEKLPDKRGHYWVTMQYATGAMTVEKKAYSPEKPSRVWTGILHDYLYEGKCFAVIIAWQPYYCPETYDPEKEM